MGHAPATIVILGWNEWQHTRACLESLRPTLGPRDQVVVVDNGSVDETPEGLRRYPWVEVVTNAENRGFAGGCNDGAARARNDVLVFLNNDTLLPSRWLEGLLRPFADGTVAATGPRSNFVSGVQLVPGVTYDGTRIGEVQRFARTWRQQHAGEVTEVERLVGFCLAVRRSAFEALGGFDEGFGLGGFEDDDLCRRLRADGGRLLVTHESFVHHDGHVTFEGNGVDWFGVQEQNRVRFEDKHERGLDVADEAPLLSACMIVKDEEEFLPDCLASLVGAVDEVVVYDTGSTDRTREIAEAAGAVVVQGFWDDDFGRARNAALAACRGTWVLHIDADERLLGEGPVLRNLLRTTPMDQYNVRIDNAAAEGSDVIGFSHAAARLFRRARGRWLGRLHEQIVARPGQQPLRVDSSDAVRLLHLGYRADVMEQRDKLARNVRVAEAEVAAGGELPAHALLGLGRSLQGVGRQEEALARFAEARTASGGHVSLLRQALRGGAESLLALGRSDEALAWVDDLAGVAGSSAMAAHLGAVAHLQKGDPAAALRCMEGLDGDVVDEDGLRIPGSVVALNRGTGLLLEQRWAEAADTLRELLEDPTSQAAVWGPVLFASARAGRDVTPLAELVPEANLTGALGQALNAGPETADQFAEALWQRTPGAAPLLAFAGLAGHRTGVGRAMEWSARLRSAGLPLRCPLAALADDDAATWLDRVRAAAVLTGGFADPRGEAFLRELGRTIDADALHGAVLEIAMLAPGALAGFVETGASGPHRCLILARALHELGAHDEAFAVFEHGWAQPGPRDEDVVVEASSWLRGVGADLRADALAGG